MRTDSLFLDVPAGISATATHADQLAYWRRRTRALTDFPDIYQSRDEAAFGPLLQARAALNDLVSAASSDAYLSFKARRARDRCDRKIAALRVDFEWARAVGPATQSDRVDRLVDLLRVQADDLMSQAYIDAFGTAIRNLFLGNSTIEYHAALRLMGDFSRRIGVASLDPLISAVVAHLTRSRIHKQEQIGRLVATALAVESMTDDEKLAFAIYYRQIVDNPLEPTLRLSESELNDLFHDREDLRELTQIPIDSVSDATLLRLKMQGLRRLQAYYRWKYPERSERQVVVSGAGPAGVMHAILAALAGYKVTVVEKATDEAFDPAAEQSRRNVLALGKTNMSGHLRTMVGMGTAELAGDVKLMDFAGAQERLFLERHASYERFEKGVIEVSLVHLQNSLMDSLNELQPEAVRFGAVIDEVLPGGLVKVSGDKTALKAQLLVAAEGLGSPTAQKLGSVMRSLTHSEPMGFCFFGVPKSASSALNVTGRVQSVWERASVLFRRYKSRYPVLEHAALLLSTPAGSDRRLDRIQYFYTTLTPRLRDRAKELAVQGKQQEQHELIAQMAKRYYRSACAAWKEEPIGVLMETHCAFTEVLAASVLERSLGQGAYAVVTGDATGTTDPVCGAGARTAMIDAAFNMRTLAALDSLPGLASDAVDAYRGTALHYRKLLVRSMREEGIATRAELYKSGTERPERFLDLAVDQGLLCSEEAVRYLLMRNELRQGNREVLPDYRALLRNAWHAGCVPGQPPVDELLKRLFRDRIQPSDLNTACELLYALRDGRRSGPLDSATLAVMRSLAGRAAQIAWQRETLQGKGNVQIAWLLFLAIDHYSYS